MLDFSKICGNFNHNLEITTRPNTGHGFWLMFLFPLAVIKSTFTHSIVLTPTYKLSSIFCVGLICTSCVFLYQCLKNLKFKVWNGWSLLSMIFTSLLFHICLHKDIPFSLVSGFFSTIIYYKINLFLLRKFEQCFTIGEAAIVSQGASILMYSTGLNIVNASSKLYTSNMQISTLIIQLGLMGIILTAYLTHKFRINNPVKFYTFSVFNVIMFILIPLHILLNRSPLLWIFDLLFHDTLSFKIIIYWIFCSSVAILSISNQILTGTKATTSQRKVFHILAVSVFMTGLLFKCSLLYLSSGVVLGIFCAIEVLRISKIPPLGNFLQDGFVVFSDEKDTGMLALTPIYLLVGCSLPIWLHPAPCDVTDSAIFNLLPLLSGILTIGIGDSAASVIGSQYGKHFWKNSRKTIEGTVACILSQLVMVYLLIKLDYLRHVTIEQHLKSTFAIVISSLIEAKTTQVDNLVLPLVMYILLI